LSPAPSGPGRQLSPWSASLAVAGLAGSIDEGSGLHGAVRAVVSALIGLALSRLFLRHAVRRFGGVSGDVFGAVVEIAITSSLIAVAMIR
jgi:adenosylcobinamide-GDP ribazoletransferase